MAKLNAIGTIETLDNGDTDLVIRVPWDQESLLANIENCNVEKKSVTLINGDIVAEATRRGNVDLYVNIGPHRVLLRGGVNIYISRPEGVGKRSKAAGYTARDAQALETAANADAFEHMILRAPVLRPDGSVKAEAGDRVRRDQFSDWIDAGCTYTVPVAPAPEAKHTVLTTQQSAAVAARATDLKAAEVGIASEPVFAGKGKK